MLVLLWTVSDEEKKRNCWYDQRMLVSKQFSMMEGKKTKTTKKNKKKKNPFAGQVLYSQSLEGDHESDGEAVCTAKVMRKMKMLR